MLVEVNFYFFILDKEVSKKLALDSMYRLEHGVEDKTKQKSIIPSLIQLEEYKEKWKDDYMLNKALRQQFRVCAFC